MSAKSTAQPDVQTRSFASKRLIFVSVIIVAAIFLTIITYYPLMFNSENAGQKPPATEVK